jgi:hypothetical protein
VRDRHLEVVRGEEGPRADADVDDRGLLAALQVDEVPELVGVVEVQRDAADEVRDGVLGGDADDDAEDAAGRQQRREVDAPDGDEGEERREDDPEGPDVLQDGRELVAGPGLADHLEAPAAELDGPVGPREDDAGDGEAADDDRQDL